MNYFFQDILSLKSLQKGTIGIMGGSFNPPHNGHLHISNFIINKLNLNLLLWLITPSNPLKEKTNLIPLEDRLLLCNQITKNNYKIKPSILELSLHNNYTFNTITKILETLPTEIKVIWIMGEDLLYSFNKFYRWKDLTNLINIAIIARGNNDSYLSLNEKLPNIFKENYVNSKNCNMLTKKTSPAWSFFLLPKLTISSTEIRKKLVKNEFRKFI